MAKRLTKKTVAPHKAEVSSQLALLIAVLDSYAIALSSRGGPSLRIHRRADMMSAPKIGATDEVAAGVNGGCVNVPCGVWRRGAAAARPLVEAVRRSRRGFHQWLTRSTSLWLAENKSSARRFIIFRRQRSARRSGLVSAIG